MFQQMLAWLGEKIYSNGHALYATDGYVIHANKHESGQQGAAQVKENELIIHPDQAIFDLNKATRGQEIGDIVLDVEQLKKAVNGMSSRTVRLVLRDGQLQLQTVGNYALISGLQGNIDNDFFDLFSTTETAVLANGSTPAHPGA